VLSSAEYRLALWRFTNLLMAGIHCFLRCIDAAENALASDVSDRRHKAVLVAQPDHRVQQKIAAIECKRQEPLPSVLPWMSQLAAGQHRYSKLRIVLMHNSSILGCGIAEATVNIFSKSRYVFCAGVKVDLSQNRLRTRINPSSNSSY